MAKKTAKAAAAKKEKVDEMLDSNPNLKNTVAQIEKQFGEGAIMALGSEHTKRIEGISTGCLSLDLALGGQGIPRGRIVEMFGPESSGKQRHWPSTSSRRPKRRAASRLSLTRSTPSTPVGRRNSGFSSTPSWSANRPAAKRRCISRKCSSAPTPSTSSCSIRSPRSSAKGTRRRNRRFARGPTSTPDEPVDAETDRGDRQIEDLRHLHQPNPREDRRDVRQPGDDPRRPGAEILLLLPDRRPPDFADSRRGDLPIGQRVKAKVVKNKVAPPFRVAEFDMMHTDGISYEGDILDLAMEKKLVVRSGAWFRYGDNATRPGPRKSPPLPQRKSRRPAKNSERKFSSTTKPHSDRHFQATTLGAGGRVARSAPPL